MSLDGDENSAEVELAPNMSTGSNFFIDRATCWSLFSAIAMLTGFFIIHFYAALQAPSVFSHHDAFLQLNGTAG
jgi:uncharacterized membrane protein